MAGRVKGVASLRRVLRRLPDNVRKELGQQLQVIGQRQLAKAKFETPVRTGRLRAALDMKVAVKSLALRLGLLTKAKRKRYFYGYILDAGRRAGSVTRIKGRNAGKTFSWSAIPHDRYNFVFGRRRDIQQNEIPRLRTAVERALHNAITSSGND